MRDLIGRTLGHYRIVEKIGEGGMGEVYRAHDERLDRDVAIKVLPDAVAQDPDRIGRFEREAKLLASLNHPNIATLYGLEEHEGQRFLVMELVEGETLAERLKKGPIPVDDALPVALQIAEGLEAAHEHGIIHRDLKPANVMVSPEGEVKVLDFGLAKAWHVEESDADLTHSPTLTGQMTAAGVLLGTAAYMSPEQARGKSGGQARRHLGLRGDPVRDADRDSAVRGRNDLGRSGGCVAGRARLVEAAGGDTEAD